MYDKNSEVVVHYIYEYAYLWMLVLRFHKIRNNRRIRYFSQTEVSLNLLKIHFAVLLEGFVYLRAQNESALANLCICLAVESIQRFNSS